MFQHLAHIYQFIFASLENVYAFCCRHHKLLYISTVPALKIVVHELQKLFFFCLHSLTCQLFLMVWSCRQLLSLPDISPLVGVWTHKLWTIMKWSIQLCSLPSLEWGGMIMASQAKCHYGKSLVHLLYLACNYNVILSLCNVSTCFVIYALQTGAKGEHVYSAHLGSL